ncbi:MAG: hypothetical protein Q7V88_07650 [Actinomycetota bacterium]|nr:hypothetical protein [Actinomycetota bacterium]
MELRPISGLTLRRALLGILLAAGRPMGIGEVVQALHAAGVTTGPWHTKPVHKVASDYGW